MPLCILCPKLICLFNPGTNLNSIFQLFGDTFLAALVYEFLKTNNMQISIEFANKAAAIAVTHPGAYYLTKQDIESLYEKI
mgnify:CR=1 FL=1